MKLEDIPPKYWKVHWRGARTVKYEIPWITKNSIFELEALLNKDMKVLEFGSGGSTLFFSRRVKSVLSFETSLEWFNKMQEVLNIKEIKNINLHHITPSTWEEKFPKNENFDCVLIDSKKGKKSGVERDWILEKTLETVNFKILVLDNYASRGCFPKYYNKKANFLNGYEEMIFDDKKWGGKGTQIFVKYEEQNS